MGLVHGQWSGWTEWGQCSKDCGFGNQTRHRFCNNPIPAAGGDNCTADGSDDTESVMCYIEDCPGRCICSMDTYM